MEMKECHGERVGGLIETKKGLKKRERERERIHGDERKGMERKRERERERAGQIDGDERKL